VGEKPGPPVSSNAAGSESRGADNFCAQLRGPTEPVCANCTVRKRGLNCWEVDAAPCCQLDRKQCATCDVFIAFLKSQTTPLRVRVLLMGGVVVQGAIHVTGGERLSDYLNSVERKFLPITEAQIVGPDGKPEEVGVAFVALESVALVVPRPEERPGMEGPILECGPEDC